MRIKSMPRFIFSMSILFVIAFSIISCLFGQVFSFQEPSYETVIVAKGDTLWNIAKSLEGNINENVYQIKKINNLATSDIYIGQELLIPAA